MGAIAVGISPGFAFYLLSITNASSGVGRVICGVLGDKLGALNVSAPFTLVCAIMTYAWPFATTKESLIAVGIIYGFCSGAYITLLPVSLVAMGDMHDAGRRTGLAMTGIALGAVAGPPISGALIRTAGGFHTVSYYAGAVPEDHPLLTPYQIFYSLSLPGSAIVGSVILLYIAKYLVLGTLRGKL